MSISYGLRLVLQAAYFVAVARALGVLGFGEVAAALALTAILAPFAALGTGNVLVMQVAQDRVPFAVAWGNALLAIPAAALVLGVVLLSSAALLVPSIPVSLLVALGAAELVSMRVVDTCGQAFQAYERLAATAVLTIVPFVLRGVAACGFLLAGASSPTLWGYVYLAATTVAAIFAASITVAALGTPRPRLRQLVGTIRLGVAFAVAQSATTIYGDIDKAMLARFVTLDATGVFAAGYRAVAIGFAPVMALLQATYVRFFAHGRGGISATVRFARTLAPATLSYGALAGGTLFVAAPLAPLLLGSDFREVTSVIRWLALLPLLQSIVYIGGDALTGAGKQAARAALQVGAAGLNVSLNLILIPSHGWRGAAWATLATFAVLAVAMWTAVFTARRREIVFVERDDVTPELVRA